MFLLPWREKVRMKVDSIGLTSFYLGHFAKLMATKSQQKRREQAWVFLVRYYLFSLPAG